MLIGADVDLIDLGGSHLSWLIAQNSLFRSDLSSTWNITRCGIHFYGILTVRFFRAFYATCAGAKMDDPRPCHHA